MATLDSVISCGGYTQYYWGYSATSCTAACSSGTYLYTYSTCSTPATNCIMYGADGNYATEGYYSDGTNCYEVFNDGQNIVRILAINSCVTYYTVNLYAQNGAFPNVDSRIYYGINSGCTNSSLLFYSTSCNGYYSLSVASGDTIYFGMTDDSSVDIRFDYALSSSCPANNAVYFGCSGGSLTITSATNIYMTAYVDGSGNFQYF